MEDAVISVKDMMYAVVAITALITLYKAVASILPTKRIDDKLKKHDKFFENDHEQLNNHEKRIKMLEDKTASNEIITLKCLQALIQNARTGDKTQLDKVAQELDEHIFERK